MPGVMTPFEHLSPAEQNAILMARAERAASLCAVFAQASSPPTRAEPSGFAVVAAISHKLGHKLHTRPPEPEPAPRSFAEQVTSEIKRRQRGYAASKL